MEIQPIGTVTTVETSYMWEIEDFNNFWNCKPGEAVKSPTFTTQTSNSKQKIWNIFLFLSGDCGKNKQYVSIFLQPQSNTCEEKQVRLSILNSQKKKVHGILFYEKLTSSKDRVRWGSSKFIHRHVLSEMADQLTPNNLTILCEIVVSCIGMQSLTEYQDKKMHSDVGALLENGIFTDFTLIVEGKNFATHKNILAARSPKFLEWFNDGTIEPNQAKFEIEFVNCRTLRKILQFIYAEKADFQANEAQEILRAANIFGLLDLKFQCEEVLSENLNIGNVINIHMLANKNDAENLKERSLNYIISNAREILDTSEYKGMVQCQPHLLQEIYEQTILRSSSK